MVVVHVYVDYLVDDVDVIDIIIQIALLQCSIRQPISIVVEADVLLVFVEILNLLCENVVNDCDAILDWSQVVLQVLIHLHVPIAWAWDEPVEKMISNVITRWWFSGTRQIKKN